ncbi:MAG: hypothetical protein JXR46_15805 [Calditrichaceae bacterium]|nr:hypothetical protein [Calditrichaceae bacterium]MBN2710509.1 hypothetical protein [Calditrichaceae bacterium]RQV97301.1 MAG: hypothetical protein EH224_01790 [Calditrichota bacterium]
MSSDLPVKFFLNIGIILSSVLPGCTTMEDKKYLEINNLKSLVDSEYAFSAMAADSGIKSAFLHFLSRDAVVFRPGPVNAHEWYHNSSENKAKLHWYPSQAGIASSLEMGYTYGLWELIPAGKDSATAFGHYISVWRKTKDLRWKVILDWGQSQVKTGGQEKAVSVSEIEIYSVQENKNPTNFDIISDKNIEGRKFWNVVNTYASENLVVFVEGVPPIIRKEKTAKMEYPLNDLQFETITQSCFAKS